jgi:hypothetical protein
VEGLKEIVEGILWGNNKRIYRKIKKLSMTWFVDGFFVDLCLIFYIVKYNLLVKIVS